MSEPAEYKYFAFISYNSKDQKWGKRLQRKLESFKLPSTLCSERKLKRKPISPVFFAPSDIQPGGLDDELRERLRQSEYLIVVCSPNSAKSEWVGKEIEYFHSLGRTDRIQFFIVDGEPHSSDPERECFNPVVDTLGLPEILGANIHEKIYRYPWLNRERAYVQLVSKLLGVEFDSLWRRQRRRLIMRIVQWIVGLLIVAGAIVWIALASRAVNVDVELSAPQENPDLPPLDNAVVSLYLDNEVKTDSVADISKPLEFANIPPEYIGKEVRMTVEAKNFLTVDTSFVLSRHVDLRLNRDPEVYGKVMFRLWNASKERGEAGVKVSVEGTEAISDENGQVRMQIPLSRQKKEYKVESDRALESDILYMPTDESTVLVLAP